MTIILFHLTDVKAYAYIPSTTDLESKKAKDGCEP